MILRISDNNNIDTQPDVVTFTTDEIRMKETQPFIAGTNWDYILVDLNQHIPRGYLSLYAARFKIRVLLDLEKEISSHQCLVLCEIFKDHSSELKRLFKDDKDDLKELLVSLGVKNE